MSSVISLNQAFAYRSLVADSEVGRKIARSFRSVNDRRTFDLQVEKEDIARSYLIVRFSWREYRGIRLRFGGECS
jgi:hypothetical protein